MKFQDGSRGGVVLLPVFLYLMSLHSSQVQILSTNQISSIHLNLRLRCNYFRFGKQTSAILEFFFRLSLRPYHSNRRAILHQTTKFCPNRSTHVGVITSYTISTWRPRRLHTASGCVLIWRHCLRKMKFYPKTKFHPNRTDRGDDMASY